MTAQIVGFLSRSDLGMRAPQSVSRSIDRNAAITLHYGGAGGAPGDHAGCIRTWQGWQAFHMNPTSQGGRGWVDIAYSFGFCDHGFVFAGRGFGVRTAANGTNAGNQQSHAACWIGGEASTPSQAALDAADWIIAECRAQGGSSRVWAHSDWKSTGCPGGSLRAHARARDNSGVEGHTPAPANPTPTGPRYLKVTSPLMSGEDVRVLQRRLLDLGYSLPQFGADGSYGEETANAVRVLQASAGLSVDGIVGPDTRAALERGVTPSVPAPPPPPPPRRYIGYPFPLPSGHWFGPESSNPKNHSGYWAGDRTHIVALLNGLRNRGWGGVPSTDRYTAAVADLVRKYQRDAGLGVDGLAGHQTWTSINQSPVR